VPTSSGHHNLPSGDELCSNSEEKRALRQNQICQVRQPPHTSKSMCERKDTPERTDIYLTNPAGTMSPASKSSFHCYHVTWPQLPAVVTKNVNNKKL
jgi:hypothetical protein